MQKTCAIVPAAGRGLRMGKGKPKQFLELLGKPVLVHTLEVLGKVGFLTETILVVPEDFVRVAEEMLQEFFSYSQPRWMHCHSVVSGGAERQDSVRNALDRLPFDCEYVVIHDGVRPFVSADLLQQTWKAARECGSAIAALPSTDTVKRVSRGRVVETLSRDEIWLIQTPQVFRRDIIEEAYRQARLQGWIGTDDAFLVERTGHPISVVMGDRSNIKVTTPDDLTWAEWHLTNRSAQG